MEATMKRLLPILTAGAFAAAIAAGSAVPAGAAADGAGSNHASSSRGMRLPGGFKHLVVIYEENHSFDNLYGAWGRVHGQRVDGWKQARVGHTVQVAEDGTPYDCLLQNDVTLASGASAPLPNTCQDPAHSIPASRFVNLPFTIDTYIKPADKTCPAPGVFAANGVLKDSPGAEPGG